MFGEPVVMVQGIEFRGDRISLRPEIPTLKSRYTSLSPLVFASGAFDCWYPLATLSILRPIPFVKLRPEISTI
jgi:hypothetical protein